MRFAGGRLRAVTSATTLFISENRSSEGNGGLGRDDLIDLQDILIFNLRNRTKVTQTMTVLSIH